MNKAAKPFHEQVDGEAVTGWVAEQGRSFRAWGRFRGKDIITRGSSESNALALWREAASYKANE